MTQLCALVTIGATPFRSCVLPTCCSRIDGNGLALLSSYSYRTPMSHLNGPSRWIKRNSVGHRVHVPACKIVTHYEKNACDAMCKEKRDGEHTFRGIATPQIASVSDDLPHDCCPHNAIDGRSTSI